MNSKRKDDGNGEPVEKKDDTNDTNGASGSKDLHKNDTVDLFESPGFKKLVATLLVLITLVLSGAMIVLLFKASNGGDGGEWNTAFFTVLIGLFGVLITGLFVFMAFRIDRGARWEARRVAEEVSEKLTRGIQERAVLAADKEAREVAREVARSVGREVASEVAQDIARERAGEVAAEKAEEVAAEKADATAREVATQATEAKFEEMAEVLKRSLASTFTQQRRP